MQPFYHQPDPQDMFQVLFILHLTWLSTKTFEFIYLHKFQVLLVPSNIACFFPRFVISLSLFCFSTMIFLFLFSFLYLQELAQPLSPPSHLPPNLFSPRQCSKQPLQYFKQPYNTPNKSSSASSLPILQPLFNTSFRPSHMGNAPSLPPFPPSTTPSVQPWAVSVSQYSPRNKGYSPASTGQTPATPPAAVKTIQSGALGCLDKILHNLISIRSIRVNYNFHKIIKNFTI